VTLCTAIEDAACRGPDLVALDSALQALARLDARSHDIFELHFFSGMGLEDICAQFALSPASVKRDLRKARAFIENELHSADGP
jgi:RNA polymerase sigma factor (sigma-70 family)